MSTDLCLGVARKIITPKVGALLCGYAPDTVSTSVHDDLRATAFYFCKEDVQALLMSIDVCSINTALCNELRDEIEKKYGILRGNCIIHTIHNHSGPNLTGQFGWGDIDREYYESIFRPTVLATVEESMRAPVSVKMGVATGESLIGINRRELKAENRARLGQNPWGPFDPKMTVISFKDGDGKCVANMIHYGMHGTCAGKNTEISRDWSGVMVDEIENVSGGITAFINGPEGDVGPRLSNGYTTGKGDIRYAERHGAIAAQDAYRIYRSLCGFADEDLSVLSSTVTIPLDKRISLDDAKKGYAEFCGNTVNLNAAKAKYFERQIKLYEEGYVDLESRTVEQTLIRIGDVVFVSFPYELFSEIGMRIARESRIPHTLSLSNTNGSEGYFVTEDQICRRGYEVDMFKTRYDQPYADNADWHIFRETVKNIEKLYKEGEKVCTE